jgi:hypothetical protein
MEDRPYAHVEPVKDGILTVRFTGAASTDLNFGNYLQSVRESYRGVDTIGVLFDASSASLPHHRHIKMQADWLKTHWDMMKSQCAGTAYVIPNGMVRGILNMIFALQEQPVAYEIFSGTSEAEKWLKKQLKA